MQTECQDNGPCAGSPPPCGCPPLKPKCGGTGATSRCQVRLVACHRKLADVPADLPSWPAVAGCGLSGPGLCSPMQPEICTVSDFCTVSYGGVTSGCQCPELLAPRCPTRFVGGTVPTGTAARCQVGRAELACGIGLHAESACMQNQQGGQYLGLPAWSSFAHANLPCVLCSRTSALPLIIALQRLPGANVH